jgi:cytidylate kinase
MAVIAMAGLSGGGARTLGPVVARKLGYDYVDRLILANVARYLGATVEALHQREERPPTAGERFSRLLQRILERSAATRTGGDPYFGPGITAYLTEEFEDLPQPLVTKGHELEDERYFEAIRRVMRELAANDHVVMVGRGAFIILRDLPNVLRVGIVARFEDRVAIIMKRERLTREQAAKTILARDKARADYFKRFFRIADPDASENYHLMINFSDVSLDYAADVVIQAALALEEGKLTRHVPVEP